jgi:hypothetical protein
MGIKMKKLFAFLSVMTFVASPALAANQCYTPEELRAEQMLRLHSELMVITVTCRQSSVGEDLVPEYSTFTKKNLNTIHDAELTMEHFYKVNYGGDGVERLDKLRTKLGNEYGQKIANESAPVFCSESRDKVVNFYMARPEQVDTEVDRMVAEDKSYAQLCTKSGTHIAKHGQ